VRSHSSLMRPFYDQFFDVKVYFLINTILFSFLLRLEEASKSMEQSLERSSVLSRQLKSI
jgi:hypothetical protein